MQALASLLSSALALVFLPAALAGDFDLDLDELNELSPRPGSVIDAASVPRYAALIKSSPRRARRANTTTGMSTSTPMRTASPSSPGNSDRA